jgi:hypothetical protein
VTPTGQVHTDVMGAPLDLDASVTGGKLTLVVNGQALSSAVGRPDSARLPVAPSTLGQPVLTAVSSTTNEVCSEESSVPVNLRVTLPVRPFSE